MANTSLTTAAHRADLASTFVLNFDGAKQNHYMFAANHRPPSMNTSIEEINTSISGTLTEVYRDMIMGKRISSNSISLAIRKIPYEANTIYAMYDDQDEDLGLKDYYVVVNAVSLHHVFKCLDNNMGAFSTVEPDFADIVGSNTFLYQTSDGYRWRYMYTYTSAQKLKFETSNLIPLVVNSVAQVTSVPGSIDVIAIEDVGRGYDNYIVGTLSSSDIMVDGQTTVYSLANSSAATSNGFYTGCLMYLNSGPSVGEYRRVVDYISNANGNFVTIESFFDTPPTNGTQYQIYPEVIITGSGTETLNAVARAVINATSSNSIFRVEVLERGADYDYASASVAANSAVSVIRSAEVRPIMPPVSGHGSNAAVELLCSSVVVNVSFANNEGNTIPSSNFYRQIGIIKNPIFEEASFETAGQTGSFLPGEVVLAMRMRAMSRQANVTLGNTYVTVSVGDLRECFSTGDPIVLRNGDSTQWMYTQVNAVVNSSLLTISSNAVFTESNATLFLSTTVGLAQCLSNPSGNLICAAVSPSFSVGTFVIGESSGATCTVNAISRSGEVKGFDTFVGLRKYVGTLNFGLFEPNEYVNQGNSTGLLHSYRIDSGVTYAYTSNQFGPFGVGNTITGELSSAIMQVTAKYQPEIIHSSGYILYLENREQVERQAGQTETFKTVLTF